MPSPDNRLTFTVKGNNGKQGEISARFTSPDQHPISPTVFFTVKILK